MADTSPASAARAAQNTQSPAILPAAALTCPSATGSARGTTCSTGMQRGGAVSAAAGVSISATGRLTCESPCSVAAARRSVPTSPATKQPRTASGASRNALAMISGPIPAGSPRVMAIGSFMVKTSSSA